MCKSSGEKRKKKRQKTNEVVSEQQYPSLLTRGTTLHPLKLLFKASGARFRALFDTDDSEFQDRDSSASAAAAESEKLHSPGKWVRSGLQIKRFIFFYPHTTLFIILVQGSYGGLSSRKWPCRGNRFSVIKFNKSASLSLSLIRRADRGC